MTKIEQMGQNAKQAAKKLAIAGELKNKALLKIAEKLENNTEKIIAENAKDLDNGKNNGLSDAMLDRLALNENRIKGMSDGIRQVVSLADPIGQTISGNLHKNGMEITKVRVPIGVIGIIFESRPNVTADAAALCLKTGNAVILRGGKEAINSNIAISEIMRDAIEQTGLPRDSVQFIKDITRESSTELMGLQSLDCLIPRGGAGLIRAVVENAKVPVIETGAGNCHVYVDSFADADMATEIIFNAKTTRPSVCNAIETILVHKDIAKKALPKIKARLDEKSVELRGCERTQKILGDSVRNATEEDYYAEFLDYILAVKIVDSIDNAMEHITKYSSGHSESIITENYANSRKFTAGIDSAAVYVNASTRFTDGGEFGLGAEIGISTQKLHARGPMGLTELTTVKYIILGNGQIR